jgi:hypothetical protein
LGFRDWKDVTETTLVAEPVLCWLRRALLHHYFQDNHINEPNATPPLHYILSKFEVLDFDIAGALLEEPPW